MFKWLDNIRSMELGPWIVESQQWMRGLYWRVVLCPALLRFYDSKKKALDLGPRGELAAERALLRKGMIVLYRGYEDKFGEIDLIVVDQRAIVFVEVKTRTSDYAGTPEEAVDANKESHLTRTAIGFLKWHRLTEYAARFDVVAIVWPDESVEPEIRHYQNAFAPVGQFQMFS